jgi:hypothetical protein
LEKELDWTVYWNLEGHSRYDIMRDILPQAIPEGLHRPDVQQQHTDEQPPRQEQPANAASLVHPAPQRQACRRNILADFPSALTNLSLKRPHVLSQIAIELPARMDLPTNSLIGRLAVQANQ